VVEQIDLSLLGHESAWTNRERENLMSQDAVSPVLESIVANADGTALKHVLLRHSWGSTRLNEMNQLLTHFLVGGALSF